MIHVDGTDSATEEKVQTSIRIPQRLLIDVQRAAGMRGQTMNAVVTELLRVWAASVGRTPSTPTLSEESLSETPVADEGLYQLKQYLRWFPAMVLVRELHGRIIFANGEYRRLVEKNTVAGHLPSDDFDPETARQIMERHEAVRDTKNPILSTESICVRGESQKKLALRFPILKGAEVQSIGALCFDLTLISKKTSQIDPKAGWQRAYRLADRPSLEFWKDRLIAWPDSLLRDFIRCLPAIATVKDLEGRLLCPNPEYTRVTGKHREDVVRRLPVENWSGTNQLLAEIIMYHDLLVRETEAPFISVESIPISSGNQDRLNIRFPIFDSTGTLELTGQLGFEYSVVRDLMARAEKEPDVHVSLGSSGSEEKTS